MKFNMDHIKLCDECANYECDNFVGVGKCKRYKSVVLFDDFACDHFLEIKQQQTMTPTEDQQRGVIEGNEDNR